MENIRSDLKVLFLSSEVFPFAKSGGLADVAGSLPLALMRAGMDVRLVMPFYRTVKEGDYKAPLILKNLEIPIGDKTFKSDIFKASMEEDIPLYLIEREDLYDRPNLYGNEKGDYYDNLNRFAFFCHSALRIASELSFSPDIIHCHDWQTGLVPALLKGPHGTTRFFAETATVFTIHNIGYQGIFPADDLLITGLPRADFFQLSGMEYWGNMSLLKAGIVYSDAITTVSPTYAQEIRTPEYGRGMEGLLQTRTSSLYGILNGVDYNYWSPAGDPFIPKTYSRDNTAGKQKCKESLIRDTGLDPALTERPLLGMISRLDSQKGLDIVIEILDKMHALDVSLIILGSGDEKIQTAISETADRHPGRIAIHTGFDEALAHRIMAGADIFLVPSRYEPCGLTQMYALKYGTVPVVRATGGLNDSITGFSVKTGKGNGFKFRPYRASALLESIKRAVDLFDQDPVAWKNLMDNGMKADFSWNRSAEKYIKVYRSILK